MVQWKRLYHTNAIGGDQEPTLSDNCGIVFQYLNEALYMPVSISFNWVRRLVMFWNVQTWKNTKQKISVNPLRKQNRIWIFNLFQPDRLKTICVIHINFKCSPFSSSSRGTLRILKHFSNPNTRHESEAVQATMAANPMHCQPSF